MNTDDEPIPTDDEIEKWVGENLFHVWKNKVDKELVRMCGIESEFLPDVDYYGMWSTGDTPKEAAEYAFQYAKGN